MKHISFPSIEQYRNVVKTVQERCRFHEEPLPRLAFHGTVKLHGTNSSVAYRDGVLWAQSRSQIITPESDNAGFARFVNEHSDDLTKFCVRALSYGSGDTAVVYGEWCGRGIQKGVAVSQLEKKMFIIFAIRVVDSADDEASTWFDSNLVANVFDEARLNDGVSTDQIDCIERFKTWDIEIDMAFPQAKQNLLGELTLEVEQECPVGAELGVKGVGEGIVWRCEGIATSKLAQPFVPYRVDDLVFKVKGEKHSDTKVKTLAAVDLEKVQNIKEFVEKVITDHRLEKGVDHLKATATAFPFRLDVKMTGDFLKWVGGDVLKEEADLMTESGLDRKAVMSEVNRAARQWFMTRLNEEIMGRPPEPEGYPCIATAVKG